MNKYFSNLAANFNNKENVESSYETLANNLPTENYSQSLCERLTNYNENKTKKIKASLKLVSAIFYQIFIFTPNDSPSKTMKNVNFSSSKKLFSFLRYSSFCNFFPSFPQFPD